MALLLNIDTATSYASVGVSNNGALLDMVVSDSQKEHAAFLQPAIASLAQSLQLSLADVDAIALTIGPGSYTGLRVGLSSAKGLAYALSKPLIAINTLEVMAYAARRAWTGPETPVLFCPMIDARRNEVFTAIYDQEGAVVVPPQALILDPAYFQTYETNNYLIFSGDGSNKWKSEFLSNKARFLFIQHSVAELAALAETRYRASDFASLPYLEPTYLKEFHKGL